jgi:hypothetical protein
VPRYRALPPARVVSVRLLANELASLDRLVSWLRSTEIDEHAVRSDALRYALTLTAKRANVLVKDDEGGSLVRTGRAVTSHEIP